MILPILLHQSGDLIGVIQNIDPLGKAQAGAGGELSLADPVLGDAAGSVAGAQNRAGHRADGIRIPAEVAGQQKSALEVLVAQLQAAEYLGSASQTVER